MKTSQIKFTLLASALAFAAMLVLPALRAQDSGAPAPAAPAVAPAENSGPPLDAPASTNPDTPKKKKKGHKKKKKQTDDTNAPSAAPEAATPPPADAPAK